MNDRDDPGFEAALADCAERILRGELLESVLTDYPAAYRDDLATLVPLIPRVGALARDPSPAFAMSLEARLRSVSPPPPRGRVGEGVPATGTWSRFIAAHWAKVAAAATAVFLLLFVSGAFVTDASAESLPGDTLYPVRQAREWVSLRLARSPDRRVTTQAGRIDNRAADLERALRGNARPQVVATLAAQAADAADAMVDEALRLHAAGESGTLLRALLTLRRGQEHLAALETVARPEIRPSIERLRAHLREDEARLIADAGPTLRGR